MKLGMSIIGETTTQVFLFNLKGYQQFRRTYKDLLKDLLQHQWNSLKWMDQNFQIFDTVYGAVLPLVYVLAVQR